MGVIGKPRRINGIGEVSKEEVEIYIRNSELNINRQEIPIGIVVFYIEKHGHEWKVEFGTVEEHYTSEICVQLYDVADTRLINGVPANEFVTPTKWKKLPKGWSYNIHQAELKRQANLSDLEWSIEQIDKDIDRWAAIYDISTEEKAKCRERIMCIDKLENDETRVFGGMVQWKYEDKKRWMTVEY